MKADATSFIKRLKEVLGLRWDKEICRILDIDQSLISRAKAIGAIPDNWILKLEVDHGIRKEFLLFGQGEPFMPGPAKEKYVDPDKKWVTAIFSPDNKEEVYSNNPAAGLVTNASDLEMPIGHYAEYILALEIRPKADPDGIPILTGSGIAIPLERIKRWKAEPAGIRSLRSGHDLFVFDTNQREEVPGSIYIIRAYGIFVPKRLEITQDGPELFPLDGKGQNLTFGQSQIMGRVLMVCSET